MIEGSHPATAIDLIRANGLRPSAIALAPDINNMAEAPSESAEDVAAVTVPFFGSNTGRNLAKDSRLVSGRITSSRPTLISRPKESWPSIAIISLSKSPFSAA